MAETEELDQFVAAHEQFARYKALASQETAAAAFAKSRQTEDLVKTYEFRIKQLERFAAHAVMTLKAQEELLGEMKATVDKVREWAKGKGCG